MVRGMGFVADTHVHLYPFYDLAAALHGAMTRLGALAPGLPRVICLTERSDCHFFRPRRDPPVVAHARGLFHVTPPLPPPFSTEPAGKNALLVLNTLSGEKLFVVAGRQIATSDKLEVHCIGCDAEIPDGLPLRDALEHVLVAGGVPVIPWGVGKWLGARGKIVRTLLNERSVIFAGDSSLRPFCWPEKSFSSARGRVLCGTDSLPAPGEENQIGRYATVFDAPFDERDPAVALLAALRGGATLQSVGNRGGPTGVLRRLQGMKRAGR